jgi:hypothetical protein
LQKVTLLAKACSFDQVSEASSTLLVCGGGDVEGRACRERFCLLANATWVACWRLLQLLLGAASGPLAVAFHALRSLHMDP